MSGQCLSPDVAGHALTPATRCCLGRPLPHQQADRTWTAPRPSELCPLHHAMLRGHQVLPALSLKDRSPPLSPSPGYVIHVFLTRSPLTYLSVSVRVRPFDLHALATPPAFVLSQDQTLHLKVRFQTPRAKPLALKYDLGGSHSCGRENESPPAPGRSRLVHARRPAAIAASPHELKATRSHIATSARSLHTLTTTNLFTCQRTIPLPSLDGGPVMVLLVPALSTGRNGLS